MKHHYIWIALVAMAAASACSSTKTTTAEEFVKKLSRAHALRDAKAVAEMTLCAEDLDGTTLPDSIKEELKVCHRDSLIQGLKQEMKQDAMWSRAWEDTKYVSQQDHGDHIHVEVKVGYAYSAIVLVRVGKHLKVAPNPSSFD